MNAAPGELYRQVVAAYEDAGAILLNVLIEDSGIKPSCSKESATVEPGDYFVDDKFASGRSLIEYLDDLNKLGGSRLDEHQMCWMVQGAAKRIMEIRNAKFDNVTELDMYRGVPAWIE